MNLKELNKSYQQKKDIFHSYINNIKRNSKWDIYTIINPTLIKNPYTSIFPKNYFSNTIKIQNKILLLIKNYLKYYLKNIYFLSSYFIAFILYKIYYKKTRKNNIENIIDVFALINKVNEKEKFSENYLVGVYELFEKYKKPYTLMLRPYGIEKNPFKLIKFFKIISKDKRDFIFEYELLHLSDFIKLFGLIVMYILKKNKLKQKGNNDIDKIYNSSLVEDIKYFSFDSLTRYILGENLAKIDTIKNIYSWSEFQVLERSFNYAIRKNCDHIKLVGLQFYLNYEVYFNSYVDDLDYDMQCSPHKMLVNGKYYLIDRKKIKYDIGVSLRYKDVFKFSGIKKEKNILLLGSYVELDTKYMLNSVKDFDNVIFKNHPAVDIKKIGKLPENISVSNENIYKLFEDAKIVIGTASGTAVEAVACGVSVIIIASQDNLTANPLVKYGQGKIWDIAYNVSEVELIYKKLLTYRTNNSEEIKEIAFWYKDNFFVEPTEENIIKVFELEKGEK